MKENSKRNDEDDEIKSEDNGDIKVINVETVEWLELKNMKEKILDLLWLHEMENGIECENKENQSLDPQSTIRLFQNLHKLERDMKPKDLLAYIMGLLAFERFHRGGKEWRKYVLGKFRFEYRGTFYLFTI